MNPALPFRLAQAGLFLTVLGAKLWLLAAIGWDVPFWDQWDAEIEGVVRRWGDGELGWPQLLESHNEHRIFTTRLFVLGWFVWNGQWSGLVGAVMSGLVYSGFAVVLLRLASGWLAGWRLAAFGGMLLALFGLPFAWENTIVGFQVQFYFLALFSVGHVALALASDRFGWRWAAAQGCGALACLSMGSGLLSSAAVLAVLGWQGLRRRTLSASQVASLAIAAGLVAAGWIFRQEVPAHAVLKAQGLAQLAESFARVLAWPWRHAPLVGILVLGPILLFAWRRVLRPRLRPGADAVAAGLLAWIWLQCLATAWARGGTPTLWSPRYFDLFALNVALGFACALREIPPRWCAGVAALLASVITLGLWKNIPWVRFRQLPDLHARQEWRVRAEVATGDLNYLRAAPREELPYPEPETILVRLSTEKIREVLPPSIRPPLPVMSGPETRAVPTALRDASLPVAWSSWSPGAGSGPRKWTSVVMPASTSRVLRFRVAGDLGAPGKALRLVVRSEKGEANILPPTAPGERWKVLNVFRPPGPWWIEATAEDSDAWFAFTAPVEVQTGTWMAERLIHDRAWVIGLGLTLLAASGALAWRQRRTGPTASGEGSPALPDSSAFEGSPIHPSR